MTQEQEKAKELVKKFREYAHAYYTDGKGFDKVQETNNAKQCAIICVNEILSEIYGNNLIATDKRRIYWQQVLTEIEKL